MSGIPELIKINKNIEKQNEEIIRLLKKIAGEEENTETSEDDEKLKQYEKLLAFTPDLGELYIEDNSASKKEKVEKEPVENRFRIGSLLDTTIDVGEVYFIEERDIFKLSINNKETSIDNITGDSEANLFDLEELIANESIKNNVSLDDGTVILSSQHCEKLPEILKICVEQGASKVYMPLSASAQLVSAPPFLMDLIQFDFYKNEENLLEKLFE